MRIVVTKPVFHMDRTLPTASWWDLHQLVPGVYPARFVRRAHGSDGLAYVPAAQEDADYLVATVPTVLRETYRVNQLFTASSPRHEHPDTPSSVTATRYPYEYRGEPMPVFSGAYIDTGTSLVKQVSGSDRAVKRARLIRETLDWQRYCAALVSTQAVSLNHPHRVGQVHAPIAGEQGGPHLGTRYLGWTPRVEYARITVMDMIRKLTTWDLRQVGIDPYRTPSPALRAA